MNLETFRQSPAGQLLKVGQGAAAYWAFVPHPLPPSISFDLQLVAMLAEAYCVLGELGGLGRAVPNPSLLIQPFIRREAVLSSRIEGTQADIANLYAYEAGQLYLPGFTTLAREDDVREVLNYVHALEYGLERLSSLPVSLRLVREVHARLMDGVRGGYATPGEFRRSQNWIGRPGCTLQEADFVPPPTEQMQEALNAWEKYLHSQDEYPSLIRLAFIHYQFEAIHPFIDGNGRIGRLLISLLLVHWGLLPLPLLYLSVYFEQRRSSYYDLLMKVSEQGSWREWLQFFLEGIVIQGKDAIVRVGQLQDLQLLWRQELSAGRGSVVLLNLVDTLFKTPILTISQAQLALEVTYMTAKRHIERLVEAGILEQIGDSHYNKLFVATEILQIITNDKSE